MKKQINLSSLSKQTQTAIKKELASPLSTNNLMKAIREALDREDFDNAKQLIDIRAGEGMNPKSIPSAVTRFIKAGDLAAAKALVLRQGYNLKERSNANDDLAWLFTESALKSTNMDVFKWLQQEGVLSASLLSLDPNFTNQQLAMLQTIMKESKLRWNVDSFYSSLGSLLVRNPKLFEEIAYKFLEIGEVQADMRRNKTLALNLVPYDFMVKEPITPELKSALEEVLAYLASIPDFSEGVKRKLESINNPTLREIYEDFLSAI